FPAQVRVRVKMECLALSENQFKPIIANNYYTSKHFHFVLDKDQTNQLISLFERFPMISNSSGEVIAANTWEDDSSPQGYDDKGNLRQELKTSGGFMEENNWDGKWDQPWESDEDPQVNTTTDDFPLNQDYKANGMEENKWGGEWEQPWGSDVNAQANIATDHTDFLQENTLEESQPVSATTYKVELIQTEESESSGHISDNNPDFNKSETNESDKDSSVSTTVAEPKISTDVPSWVLNLIDEVKSLKGSQLKQIVKINMLEKRLVESKQEVQQLKNCICSLEHGSQHVVDPVEVDDHELIKSQSNFDESVYIKYASAAILNGELYHFGGEGFHTAGASVKDRLFVVGGAKGRQCSSEVEYLDLDIRKWIPTCPMLSKRLAPAMAELNNALYVSGGYDGASYIR
ncbi:Kelch-like protein 2 isoform X2, partial [Tanacetum coccineum]